MFPLYNRRYRFYFIQVKECYEILTVCLTLLIFYLITKFSGTIPEWTESSTVEPFRFWSQRASINPFLQESVDGSQ